MGELQTDRAAAAYSTRVRVTCFSLVFCLPWRVVKLSLSKTCAMGALITTCVHTGMDNERMLRTRLAALHLWVEVDPVRLLEPPAATIHNSGPSLETGDDTPPYYHFRLCKECCVSVRLSWYVDRLHARERPKLHQDSTRPNRSYSNETAFSMIRPNGDARINL